MSDEIHDPQGDEGAGEDIEAYLDRKPIREQVVWLQKSIEDAKTDLFLAHQIAQKIIAAHRAGVLSKGEREIFISAVTQDIKDLQAMLVLQWSGANSDREVLEQLHHIYYPKIRPDGGRALTLDAQLYAYRRGMSFDDLSLGAREGGQREYWEMLCKFAESHPDEPEGWRDQLKGSAEANGS
jgi:hypothetical protein